MASRFIQFVHPELMETVLSQKERRLKLVPDLNPLAGPAGLTDAGSGVYTLLIKV